MRVLHYNSDGCCVSIGIAGDHQLTGARLYTGVSIAKTNQGWTKLIWNQCSEVTTQKNYIISNFQVRPHETLASDVISAHGRKQMITTPNGIMMPTVFKGGLPYLEHGYPTDKQMRDITREETMTSPGDWNPSLLGYMPNASEQRLK